MTFVDDTGSSSMSGASQLFHPNKSNLRTVQQGSITHVGLEVNGSIDACEPPKLDPIITPSAVDGIFNGMLVHQHI